MAKPRVHEIANDHGVDSKVALAKLRELGEFIKSPSSTIEPPVARKLRAALAADGFPSPAFAALNGNGGIEAASLFRLGARGFPSLVRLLAIPDHPLGEALSIAANEGAHYFVPQNASALIGRRSFEANLLRPGLVHSDRGTAMIVRSPARGQLLFWDLLASPPMLRSVVVSLVATREGDRLVPSTVRQVAVGVLGDRLTSDAEPFGTFVTMWDLVPSSGPKQTPARQGGAASRPVHRGQDGVTISYLTRGDRAASGAGGGTNSDPARAKASHRWEVRGHWRNQYYPRTGSHDRIWIEAHTAGAAEAVVEKRQRVYMISPPTAEVSEPKIPGASTLSSEPPKQ